MIKKLCSVSMILSALFFLSITPATAGSIYDVVNPAGFGVNSTVGGSFDEDHPVNYFLLSASGDGQYVISNSVGSSLYVRVYAAEPTEGGGVNIIAYQTESNASYYALQAGMYKISVLNQTGTESFSYEISNTYASATFSADIEPNDTVSQASSLLMDGDVYGHHGYAYDAYGGMPVYNKSDTVDVWKITTDADGYFIVDSALAEELDFNLNFNLKLYDEDDHFIVSNYNSNTLSNVEYQLAAGTYYIKTFDADIKPNFGSYMLTTSLTEAFLEDDPEPNNERATATVLAVGAEDTGHIGFATDSRPSVLTGYDMIYDTDDYWKITTAEDGVLTVATTSNSDFDDGPFVKINMYSAEGRLMKAKSIYNEPLTKQKSLEVAAGTYYLNVEWEGGYGSYLIACGLTPAALAGDTEPNDTIDDATTFAADEQATGHLGYITDSRPSLNGDYDVYDTDDYWKIAYDADNFVNLSLELEHDTDDSLVIYLYVYNEENTNIHTDYNNDKLATVTAGLVRESGHVYVRVKRVSGYGSYTLSATLTPGALAGDTLPNEIKADATQLPINGIGTGHLGFIKKFTDQIDYWTFYADKQDTLYVTAISENDFGEGPVMYLKLLQANTLATDYNYDYGDTSQVAYYVTPGTYFAAVNSRSGYGSYTLSVSYPSDAPIPVTILTETLPVATVGEEYSVAVEIDYGGVEAVTYELLAYPAWLDISADGVLVGTPGGGESGSEIPVTIKVSTSDSEDMLETTITVESPLAVAADDLPNVFAVASPFPNPFNGATTLSYSLPETADVRISVYNVLGQRVFDTALMNQSAGHKSFVWSGQDSGGNQLNSGVYFIMVASGNNTQIRKATYVR